MPPSLCPVHGACPPLDTGARGHHIIVSVHSLGTVAQVSVHSSWVSVHSLGRWAWGMGMVRVRGVRMWAAVGGGEGAHPPAGVLGLWVVYARDWILKGA